MDRIPLWEFCNDRSDVEIRCSYYLMFFQSGPNTGSNPGEGRVQKKSIYIKIVLNVGQTVSKRVDLNRSLMEDILYSLKTLIRNS